MRPKTQGAVATTDKSIFARRIRAAKPRPTKYDVWNACRGRNDPRQAHWTERIRVVPEPT